MSSPPLKVLFYGHSHLKYLSTHIRDQNPNFGLSENILSLRFLSVGGMKIGDLLSEERLAIIREFEPHTIVLMIGDNNITPFTDPQSLVQELLNASSHLLQLSSVRSIVFTKIMPRDTSGTSKYLFPEYNFLAFQCNRLLYEALTEIENVRLFSMDWPFPQDNIEKFRRFLKYFQSDGVHFSFLGLKKVMNSFRSIVITSIKHKSSYRLK